MGVVNLRDAIILSILKDSSYSKSEIINKLGIQKTLASRSLSFLEKSGMVSRTQKTYLLTENGARALEKIVKKVSID